ncbi:MAG: ABC transporter ATP-binding protein, partial [Treponema sp.]|nr:ABC transporter ATP-binding protein [Treponema sp.]
ENEAKEAISSIDSVDSCTVTEGDKIEVAPNAISLLVSAKDGKEIRPELFRLCAGKNWTIYELAVRKNSLEDIFHGLTVEEK